MGDKVNQTFIQVWKVKLNARIWINILSPSAKQASKQESWVQEIKVTE